MFSVLLELPEFEVTNQDFNNSHYFVHIEKINTKERCPFCGFYTSKFHDQRTKKVRDLPVLNKLLYLNGWQGLRRRGCERY